MSKPPSSNNKKLMTSPKGITAISVRGYKSLYDECRFEIRPLTILAGANSSGKSSAIQPLLLLKQTAEALYKAPALLLNGPNVRFTSIEQFFSKIVRKKLADEIIIKLEIENGQSLFQRYRKLPDQELEIAETTYTSQSERISLRPAMKHDEIVAAFPGIETSKSLQWEVRQAKCFLSIHGKHNDDKLKTRPFYLIGSQFEAYIRELIHVPGLRGNPERTYKTSAISTEFPGTFENYVASVIHYWQVSENNRLRQLSSALASLGLTWKVEAKRVDNTQVELRVGRLSKLARSSLTDVVSIADVGFGMSQILPVLVALLAAEPGQMVYLEQPEIHLHPRAQVALAQVLADAANRGVRVVAETHSSLLLLGVQSLVAEDKLSPEKIKLHWFKRRADGVTEVTSADLETDGAFGDWPEDFAEVALETESRYIEAAALSHRKK